MADRFVDGHYGSLRGRVRTYVIDQQLREHLPPQPARLVDVGGAAGHQALPLARAGYEVIIVDPSAAMLKRAHAFVAQESPEVRERIRLVEATAAESPNRLGRSCFAEVLCHGVIMYVDDPRPILATLAELAHPGAASPS
jgi:2-polyprenyl-3-methyl-5-hydroxy-6-metoxy-1,4-benzoquinol methylase